MIRKLILMAVAVAAIALCAACNKGPQPPLVFGAGAWPGYEPLYLAHDLGSYQGVNLRLEGYADPAAAEANFRSGKIQLVALPLERALLLRQDVPDLKIILLLSTGPGKRMDVLVTRDQVIGQYHHELQQLLQGWRKALDSIRREPDKSAQVMARREGITDEQYRALSQGVELYSFERDQKEMIGEPPPVSSSIEAVQRDLLARGKLSMGMDTSILVDSTLVAEPGK